MPTCWAASTSTQLTADVEAGQDREDCVGRTLKAPDIVAEPVGREVAAAIVQPGQHEKVWGEWRVVRHKRTETNAEGRLAVVLALDEGPALRVPAAEPLVVRDGEPL